jgi:glucose-1-phosphate thymidylyltransferase
MGDDLYHKKDITNLLEYEMAILGYEVDDPSKFGVIKTNRSGHMVDVIEKPKRSKFKLANTGAYVIKKDFFDYDLVPIGGGEFGLPQTLAKMAPEHTINVVKTDMWYPIGNPQDLKNAEKILHKFI